MASLGRGASSGMSQSMIGGVGGRASQDTRPNRNQISEDDSGTQHESGKAPSAGRSGLGDVNPLFDSLRSQISGTFSIVINIHWFLILTIFANLTNISFSDS